MDIKGFTPLAHQLHPKIVLLFLNDLYARFDLLAERYGVYKVRAGMNRGG